MGILNNIGDQVDKHADKINDAIDKGGDFIDSKTDGKFAEHVDKGQEALKGAAEKLGQLNDDAN